MMMKTFSAIGNADASPVVYVVKTQTLKTAMEKWGFKNYPKEWWHFTLQDETYRDDYFDFEVQ